MELTKTKFTFSGDKRMIWSDEEYSPASAEDGKRRQRHSQTVDVAVFPWYISPVRRDVARPRRSAIFQIRAVASNRLWEFSPPAPTFHCFFLCPAGFVVPPPVGLSKTPLKLKLQHQRTHLYPLMSNIKWIFLTLRGSHTGNMSIINERRTVFLIDYFSSGGSNVYF